MIGVMLLYKLMFVAYLRGIESNIFQMTKIFSSVFVAYLRGIESFSERIGRTLSEMFVAYLRGIESLMSWSALWRITLVCSLPTRD